MADLQTKSFDTLVQEQATAVQGGSTQLVDFSVGSILRAVVEAYAAVALWLQGLILKLLATTRAATSTGTDLDTWVADYGLSRLGASPATGLVTFSRFTATSQAVVPIGATVQTTDGSQVYAVTLDSQNSAYNANLGGYVLAAGTASLTLPVSAVTAGAVANAAIGGINTLGQALPGIDTASNAAALVNGTDAETDTALRLRFVEYIASLSKATKAAVAYAITSVESGLVYSLVENENPDGTDHVGFFYVVVDDGSGEPSDGLIARVYAAIDAVRPLGSIFGVFKPTVEQANVVLTIAVGSTFSGSTAATAVQTALSSYINALPLGGTLSWSKLIQIAYDATPGITNVSGLTINGATADITATPQQVVKTGFVSVLSD